jgi:hypothetical protein
VWRRHPQAQKKTNTAVVSVENERVTASKRMQLAVTPIVAGEETNKDNSLHCFE